MNAAPTDPRHREILDALRGRLIVSCQAREGEPLHGPVHMTAMALSVLAGGAAGVRLEGPDDIAAVRAATVAPIIGLWKFGEDPVYITPTLATAHAVAEAGADIVAVDGTGRPRPDGILLATVIEEMHRRHGLPVMADVATLAQARDAVRAGADVLSTTLSGYAGGPDSEEPDLTLVRALAAESAVPVFAEGRIAIPEEAAEALRVGAWAVVVGSAITRPTALTARFVAALDRQETRRP